MRSTSPLTKLARRFSLLTVAFVPRKAVSLPALQLHSTPSFRRSLFFPHNRRRIAPSGRVGKGGHQSIPTVAGDAEGKDAAGVGTNPRGKSTERVRRHTREQRRANSNDPRRNIERKVCAPKKRVKPGVEGTRRSLRSTLPSPIADILILRRRNGSEKPTEARERETRLMCVHITTKKISPTSPSPHFFFLFPLWGSSALLSVKIYVISRERKSAVDPRGRSSGCRLLRSARVS